MDQEWLGMKWYFSLSVVLLLEKSAMTIVFESGGCIRVLFEGALRRLPLISDCLHYVWKYIQ